MPNGQQKKQQIFFRLTAFARRRWRLVFSLVKGYQANDVESDKMILRCLKAVPTLFYTMGLIHTRNFHIPHQPA